MSPLNFKTLFESEIVRIVDVRCRGAESARSQEEYATSHHLLFTRAGTFVKHGPGRSVAAEPGQLLFFTKDEPFRVSHPDCKGDDCTLLAFAADTIREAGAGWRREERFQPPFAVEHAPASLDVVERQKRLRRALLDGTSSQLWTEEAALHILGRALHDARPAPKLPTCRPATRDSWRATVESARLILAREPGLNLSLAALGQSVGRSPFHLARVFRAELGMSVHQYRLRMRLAIALERIAEGPCDLTELALDTGFSSHSHFTRTFARALGVSPSQFRKSVSAGALHRYQRKLLGH